MQDLIERLEMATGPDRELDGAIWCGLFQTIAECWPHWTPRQQNELPPDYTRSIDTALTLVPDWSWRIGNLPSGRAFADLGTQASLQCVEGATPAIALCIAALKARPASSAGKEG